jgi:hypothetical protein
MPFADRSAVPWCLLAAGLPLLLAIVSAAVLVMAAAGYEPLWEPPAVTMSEAAALRDAATALQLIRAGHNPNDRYPVRAGIIRSHEVVLTPLEAAVAARREEVVQALLAHRAKHPGGIEALRCLAAASGALTVVAYLDGAFGAPASEPACGRVEVPW